MRLIDSLLEEYRNKNGTKMNPRKIIFNDMDGLDVYNPTAPFTYNRETYIAARVERRDNEESESLFFKQNMDGTYSLDKDLPRFKLQDPFITVISKYFIFGGTEIFPHSEDSKRLQWRTTFYYGESIKDLKELAAGPIGMKDIRLVELKDGRIGVFTRPQAEKGGRGKIGFAIIDKLTDLTVDVINDAPVLEQFDSSEWGGCNEAILLSNGKIGVLGHIAKFSEGSIRHYYPMVFQLDPETLAHTSVKIIAERRDFLSGPAKRDDLQDVLFSAGLIRNCELATLYTGVSDAEVQAMEIKDPFAEYE